MVSSVGAFVVGRIFFLVFNNKEDLSRGFVFDGKICLMDEFKMNRNHAERLK